MNLKSLRGMGVDLKTIIVACLVICSLFGGKAEAVEPKIATGLEFSVYLAPDGRVWTWGRNQYGQLGHNDVVQRTSPTLIPGLTDVVEVATGYYHAMALTADGTVWAWGRDSEGQTGQGVAVASRPAPIQVPGLSGMGSIACGGYHSMALTKPSGQLYSWGYNVYGQLGNGNTTTQLSPVGVGSLFRTISGGGFHSVGIGNDGAPYAWGRDLEGQVGNDVAKTNVTSPTLVAGGFTNVVSISAGGYHSIMCLADTAVYTWGHDGYGQLGNGAVLIADQPTPASLGYTAWKVSAGDAHSLIFYPGGYVYAFGHNSDGQCRSDPAANSQLVTPQGLGWLNPRPNEFVGGLSRHVLFTQSNGALAGWGDNSYGQLGLGSTSNYQFTQIAPAAQWSLDVFTAVSAGNAHTLALKADGTVWAWGSDSNGQLGDDAILANKSAPVQVEGLAGVMEVCAGGYHSMALTTGGSVYAWGWDAFGQLGNDATLADSPTPVSLPLSYMSGLGAGAYHSLAIYAFGRTVRSWGSNGSGQLGDATNTQQPTPVTVSGLNNILKVEAGYQHSMALSNAGGTVYTWGADGSGQLGNDVSLVNSNVPVTVTLSSMIDIAGGQSHSTSTRTSGLTRAWGADYSGQLGNGAATDNQPTPSVVSGLSTMKAVSAGADFADFSVYLSNNGLVYSCGSDNYGQLGNDVTILNQPALVQVAGLSQIYAITAGDYHAHALRADGTLHSWGYNGLGQLGNDALGSNTATPVTITTNTWKPTIALTIPDSVAGETGPNPGTIRFTRSFANAGAVTVNYDLAGTAVNGSDYTTLSGSAVIPAGASFVDVTLTPIDDFRDEDNESVDVTLIDGTQYRVGSPSNGSLTISDNDTSGFIISAISANTQEADQVLNTAGTFTVRLATQPSGTVVLTFGSTNTAEGLVDTDSTAGNQGATTLTFTALNWNIDRTVQVFGRDDDFDDGNVPYFIAISVNQVPTLDSRYDPLDPPDVSVTNIDNDTAGVSITAISGPVTEAGGTATFAITLTSRPYNPVNFTLTSSDTTEGVLQAGSSAVTINPANWNTGAIITVQGVNDDVADGNQGFKIDIAKSGSSDPAYNNLGGWDVPVTCNDDDIKGVTIDTDPDTVGDQGTPLAVSEGGSTDTFTVRLNSQPTAQVTLTINTPASVQVTVDTDAGTVGNQNTLTFTTANWSTPQTVQVSAIDDAVIEASPHSGTVLSVVNGGSGDYSIAPAVTIANISCNITDNDTPGFTVAPTTTAGSRQITTEQGGTAAFTVKLKTRPTGAQVVVVRLNSNDITEGRIGSSYTLDSTSANGATNTLFFADVTGIEVGSSLAVESITVNNNPNPLLAEVVSVDVGTNSIVVGPYTGSPAMVTVGSAETIRFVSPTVLIFNNSTWNDEQLVTVTGIDDLTGDGDRNYGITFDIDPSTTETNYASLLPAAIPHQFMKNVDNDIPGVTITQSGGTTVVTEADVTPTGQDSFTVRLNTAPASFAIVTLTTDGQVTLDKTTLVFTPTTFNTLQTVTVTAVNDAVDESSPHNGTISFSISDYGAITTADPVVCQIIDDDTAGITVVPTFAITTEDLLATNFSINLTSQPTANVTIALVSTDTGEGTVAVPSVVFTPANWYLSQSVTVTGVDDDVDDGDQIFGVITAAATSVDSVYNGMNAADVLVVNLDNDNAGVTASHSGGSTAVVENGATDTISVVLTTEPAGGDVTVTLSPGSQVSLSTTSLIFTDSLGANPWNVPQNVTVTAVNDDVAEGAHNTIIGFSASGPAYTGLSITPLVVSITDNDTAGTTKSVALVTTTESGGSDAVTFRLNTQPTGNVTVVLASSDTGEGTVSPSSLTFTPGNFATPQNITVSGVDDDVDDGDIDYEITFTLVSADPGYNNLAVIPLDATNTDGDAAGFIITAISNDLREDGTSGRFTVRLTSEPVDDVTIGVAAGDATEAVTSVASLTFDANNWNQPQEVTVSGVDDFLNDGDIGSSVILSADTTTADPNYFNNNPADVVVTTLDDDQAGVAVSTPAINTSEDGLAVTFTVQLLSQPNADVTIPLASGDTTEGTVDPASLVFTAANWNTPQTVTITPVDDFAVDGSVVYTLALNPVTTSDTTGYSGLDPNDVIVTNADDDAAGFPLTAITATTAESATSVDIDVVLTSQPSTNVVLTITGLDVTEGSLSASSLTFTSMNWDTPQALTITGVSDDYDDDDQAYVLTLTPSGDTTYAALPAQTITVTNTDDDAAAVVITQSGGTTVVHETGTTDSYTIQLASRPLVTATVTVTPDSQVQVGNPVISNPVVLTFDPALSSGESTAWNTVHTITVSAVVDTFDEANPHAANITHAVANYVDQASAAVTASPVSVTVNDNDPPQTVVTSLTLGRGLSDTITSAMISATDDDTPAANLLFTVILAPGQGELWLDYGVMGQDQLINGESFTQAAITANRLSYRNSGTPNVSDGFAFRVSDAVGNQGDLTIFNITITGFIPPTITLNGAYSPSYIENDPPVQVDTAPTVSDADLSGSYKLLTITLSGTGVSTDDEVYFATSGLITASSGTIIYDGGTPVPIGNYNAGGTGTAPLTVSFIGTLAGDLQVTELLKALRYRNNSEDPVAGTRTVSIELLDATDTSNAPVTKDIAVLAINDSPTVANATVITPKNVAITTTLTAYDVDNYPLTVDVTAPPGKGTLSGILDVLSQTTIADALASRSFTYTPSTGLDGTDSFTIEVTDPDGATSTATITVLIIGGTAARPWIISDAPTEAEAGSPLSYDIVVDFTALLSAPTLANQVSYTLIGTLPAGVTFGGFTPSLSIVTNAALTLTVGPSATGVIEAGIVVTETASNTSGYQPVTIVIVPPGTLGN